MASKGKGPLGALTKEIALLLKTRATYVGKSNAELASSVGLSESTVSRIMNGKMHVTVQELDLLCRELDKSIVELVEEADKTTQARFLSDSVTDATKGLI